MLTEKEKLVFKLTSKGMTQKKISKKIDVTQSAVSKFHTNALKKIEDAKVTLEWIKNYEKKKEK